MSELKLRFQDDLVEIGCDEVGRGCCAGPVVAAAVMLDSTFSYSGLRDSKKMSEKQREAAFKFMTSDNSGVICYSIGLVSPPIIDEINILNASMKAMHLALDGLRIKPSSDSLILVDGNQFHNYNGLKHECIIKGDDKYLSIAAASVIAKVYRDRLMEKLSMSFPNYKWESNKGYGTKAHLQAIADHGYTVHHRMSYSLKLPQPTC